MNKDQRKIEEKLRNEIFVSKKDDSVLALSAYKLFIEACILLKANKLSIEEEAKEPKSL